jgi:hypothetical protein
MKKKLMLLAGLLVVSSLALADVQGNAGNFTIDKDDQILTFGIKACVNEPLAAWWKDKGFFGSKTLDHDMGALSIGQNLPNIPDKEIYVIAPYSKLNRVHASIAVAPMVVKHTSGAPSFTVPIKLKDKNGYAAGQSIQIDPDSAGGNTGDGKAVIDAVAATGLTGLGAYLGGEIIQLKTVTNNIAVPFKPGNYYGSAKITVKLVP